MGRSRLLLFFLLALCGIVPSGFAQRYEARLLDMEDKQPVAYANIGIPGTEAGTNSDSMGLFVLQIPEEAKDKQLSVSLIGYEEYKVNVSELPQAASGDRVIYLKKSVQPIAEVVVRPTKLTQATLGNNIVCQPGEGALPFPYLYEKKKKGNVVRTDTITEIGTLMKVKRKKTFIDSVQINIGSVTYESILYRLNIYEEIKGEFKNILREPIYIRRNKGEIGHTIKVDLSDKNLVVNNNFIVSIEKVKDLGPGSMTICGKMFGAAMYMRIASRQDLFIKLPVIGMGIMSYVTFSEEK